VDVLQMKLNLNRSVLHAKPGKASGTLRGTEGFTHALMISTPVLCHQLLQWLTLFMVCPLRSSSMSKMIVFRKQILISPPTPGLECRPRGAASSPQGPYQNQSGDTDLKRGRAPPKDDESNQDY